MKKSANKCRCKAPPREGERRKTCGRPALYWVEVDGEDVPVCHPHYAQVERRGGVLAPLVKREVPNPAQPCSGPKCERPGRYVKSGRPLCDTHQKQWDRKGKLSVPKPYRKEAA